MNDGSTDGTERTFRQYSSAPVAVKMLSHPDGANRGGYSNARVDLLTEAARREPSREKRREMYREVQRILASDLPVFPLWAGRNLLVRDRRLQGFALTPDESYAPVRGMRIAEKPADPAAAGKAANPAAGGSR